MAAGHDALTMLYLAESRAAVDDPMVFARLAIIRAIHCGNPGIQHLAANATLADAFRLDRDPRAADAAFLRAVADGAVNLFDDPIWQRLEPIHERYKADSEMMQLFARAADAFAGAAEDAAAAVLAGPAAALAIKKASQPRRDS